jgi:hypothetical protein
MMVLIQNALSGLAAYRRLAGREHAHLTRSDTVFLGGMPSPRVLTR